MRLAFTLSLGVLAAACVARPPAYNGLRGPDPRPLHSIAREPVLGVALGISEPSSVLEMTASGQMYPSYRVLFRGIEYVVAVDSSGVVRYVSTQDPAFSTPEGIHVGSLLQDVQRAGAEEPIAEPGWGFHTTLHSGWQAAFINGGGLTEQPLLVQSRVAWLFKRS